LELDWAGGNWNLGSLERCQLGACGCTVCTVQGARMLKRRADIAMHAAAGHCVCVTAVWSRRAAGSLVHRATGCGRQRAILSQFLGSAMQTLKLSTSNVRIESRARLQQFDRPRVLRTNSSTATAGRQAGSQSVFSINLRILPPTLTPAPCALQTKSRAASGPAPVR
jgi:hypothetical protein